MNRKSWLIELAAGNTGTDQALLVWVKQTRRRSRQDAGAEIVVWNARGFWVRVTVEEYGRAPKSRVYEPRIAKASGAEGGTDA